VPQDGSRTIEREVRNDAEGLARKRKRPGIGLQHIDVRPSPAKSLRPVRIELDCEYVTRSAGELRGQPAAARAKIEHQLFGADSGVTDELRGKRTRTEKVLATRAARPTRTSCASLGHGPSPSSSSAHDDMCPDETCSIR
jgi:hypothetical protein